MVTKNQLLKKANQLSKSSGKYHNHHNEFMNMIKKFIGVDDLGDSFSDAFIDDIEYGGYKTINMKDIEQWISDFKGKIHGKNIYF